MHLVGY